ncbi:MAG TPA: leucyl aminopeptidase [Gemmatimonadaceae bacterium]|nr:leucyl aminopeptidase [Gemmatimonadaceae bacterium]
MPVNVSARRAEPAAADVSLLAIALRKDATLPAALTALDAAMGGALSRLFARRDFRGGRDEVLHLAGAASGPQHVLLVGLGTPAGADLPTAIRRAASLAARQARKIGAASMAWWDGESSADVIESAATGIALGAWEYADLKTPPPTDERRPELASAVVLANDLDIATPAAARGNAIADGMNLARRLATMPGNLCTPEYLAETAREIGARHDLRVTVLGRAEMQREGMGSFLAVAQGTPQDPKLITLEYRHGPANAKPIALVGKGLCFDSGGISIKPAQGMEAMKFDMCGAAGVLGAMETIARLALPINVVGLIGSTTNMPSGTAINPGDVVKSHSGKFIEIINTDAEGRLVLADVLSYARRFEPTAVIDAATLTGACVVALGHSASGVFGNDVGLVADVLAAGKRSGETGWELPLLDEYKDLIKSDVADLKNTGGRPAGAITAAMFLKEFAESFPWVHLDIAGTAYSETDLGHLPKGPTGVPVGTFVAFARSRAR